MSEYAGKVEKEDKRMQAEGVKEEEVEPMPEAEEVADEELVVDPSEVGGDDIEEGE